MLMELNKINYKKGQKHYNTSRKPKKQSRILNFILFIVCKILLGRRYKVEKINMKGQKSPYVLFSNHMAFVDFEVNIVATFPHRVNNITTLEQHYRRAWIMRLIGCIAKRKFTTDAGLLDACKTVVNDYKSVLSIYPEARFSEIGITGTIPKSYAHLVKALGKSVVVLLHHGNHLRAPFWNWRKKRKVKLYATMTKILDEKEVKEKSVDEIYEILLKAFEYDDYKYQKENNIIIDAPYRAEGLHKVLYKCPHCNTEYKMTTKGATIKCESCGKEWEMSPLGEMVAKEGQTEFSHIPDWFRWQKECVKGEIADGLYDFSTECDVYSLPNTNKFIHLGTAELKHSYKNGFTLDGEYNGEKYRISRPTAGLSGLHIEYDYCYLGGGECLQLSTRDDTFVCYPKDKNVVTKLFFATDIMYDLKTTSRISSNDASKTVSDEIITN